MSSAYDDIKRALDEMESDGSKITKNAVATRAKRNIANLSKIEEKWINLRVEIEDAQTRWEEKKEETNKDELIQQLKAHVSNLKSKLANEKHKSDIDPKVYDKKIEKFLVLLQEMYAEIDKLKLINADLQNQLVHSGQQREIRMDESTGEIIELISSTKRNE
ncbi:MULTISPECIES: hypothetical protein [Aliiglaciecola]|uniref:hypothetical protein n=1 Tax=Aliiglaciecola TaxID=1406885 RepID=UPI001C089652|nr:MULTISPECIES: hypothetical protein [Aliiglaciecola]MBU2878713.1 hypothetical protein [Aliiglaciecola lipolytica]MDO6711391.1 hypothetical protein [Aliiglaciecola sp. 2_MG-2023]MDO6752160.1 hypothetical protein [Aliiglaciecola sp. 1_MG-2023]